MVPKFNANIKFKLTLGLFKYLDIKKLDNIIGWEILNFT